MTGTRIAAFFQNNPHILVFRTFGGLVCPTGRPRATCSAVARSTSLYEIRCISGHLGLLKHNKK